MKKALVLFVLFLGITFITTAKLGAKMSTNDVTEVRAEHILVKTKAQADELKSMIDSGKISFEDAAKQYSSCPSGANGGDLDYFGRGMMVKEFENAAFDAEKGTVTDPVQTQFGWHLIKVLDKR